MVMPGGIMGTELAEHLLNQWPRLRVIYTSGYSPGMAGRDTEFLSHRTFIPKPYTIGQLSKVIRECLDAPAKHD
jgi:DNA-binding NtrC family response regulator